MAPTPGELSADRRLMRGKYIHLIRRGYAAPPSPQGEGPPIASLRSALPPAGEACGRSKPLPYGGTGTRSGAPWLHQWGSCQPKG